MGFAKTKVPKQPPAYSVGPETSPMKNLFSTPKTSTFACILLSRSDRLRLVDFPQDVIPAVHQAVTRVWAPGVQGQGPYEGGWEWKLSGRPWGGQGFEAIPARRLIVHVLHALASVGWFFYCSADLSKKGWDKDTLFFRPGPPVQRYFFAISFNESDKIRLIDSPNPMVSDAFVGAVRTWPRGIQEEKEKEAGCFQMKLKGTPWWSSDGATVIHARMLACTLLSAMEASGFELVGSVDMSMGQGGDENHDLDTWFFANKQ